MAAPAAPIAPSRSLEQRRAALKKGNDIRLRRAQLKRDLRGGRQDVLELIVEPPAYLLSMKMFELLLATPKYGRVKANKAISRAHISPSKTVGGMTQRQRDEIAAYIVHGRAPWGSLA